MDRLLELDQNLFLIMNGWHGEAFDAVMYWGTQTWVWFPLVLLLLYLVVRAYRWKSILLVVTLILTVTVSDQSASLAKSSFQRFRPSRDPVIAERVHVVNDYRGGQYGFFSGHAANTMAIALFLILLLKSRYRWIAALLLPWALFMSYTRLYLGVHYPGDLLVGMVVGGIIGWLGAQLFGLLCGLFCKRDENPSPV